MLTSVIMLTYVAFTAQLTRGGARRVGSRGALSAADQALQLINLDARELRLDPDPVRPVILPQHASVDEDLRQRPGVDVGHGQAHAHEAGREMLADSAQEVDQADPMEGRD